MVKYLHIYIFRHGKTHFNKAHRFTGWKDSKLAKEGIADAKLVAKKLKNKKFDLAIQSRLTRSKRTLREVLKFHPECKKIITDDRIIERCYGVWQGKTHKHFISQKGTDDYKTLLHFHKIDHLHGEERAEFVKQVGEAELKVIRRSYSVRPPKGESVRDVEKRVIPFIKELIKRMKKENINVAISAHGNSMRPFRRYFEKFSIHDMMKLENPFDNYFEYKIKV